MEKSETGGEQITEVTRQDSTQRGHLDGYQASIPKFRSLQRSVDYVPGTLVTWECLRETAVCG